MANQEQDRQSFNIVIVGQNGRLQYEALLFVASLRHSDPNFAGRLFVAEPQQGPLWKNDPRMGNSELCTTLADLGAEIVPFESRHFGKAYPYGNKIEALAALPEGEPFVFFDTDTLVTGALSEIAFDFERPSASMQREGTWPKLELYGPGYSEIWRSLYDKFGLAFEPTLDMAQPDEYWQRYMYFNAGWFHYKCPRVFGQRFAEYAVAIRDDPPLAAALQEYDPWLDQVALPLVIASLGGGRPGPELDGLDGDVTCHWRVMPLLYAREADHVVQVLEAVAGPNKVKKLLKQHEPFKKMIYQGKGQKVRSMFDRSALPRREQALRNRIKSAKLWMR